MRVYIVKREVCCGTDTRHLNLKVFEDLKKAQAFVQEMEEFWKLPEQKAILSFLGDAKIFHCVREMEVE